MDKVSKNYIVVSDTTAITHLARVDLLHLLQALFNVVYIPEAVYQELVQYGDQVPGSMEVKTLSWIKKEKVRNTAMVTVLSTTLDPGESEAIALAVEKNADLLIIDEFTGRNMATQHGVNITGVLGILLKAKERKLINKVKPHLDNLRATKFKVSPSIYEAVLNAAGESRLSKKA